MFDEGSGIGGLIALIGAAGAALGVIGTLVTGFFKGRAGLDQAIDDRVKMILDHQSRTIERKDQEILAKDHIIGQQNEKIEALKGEIRNLLDRVTILERLTAGRD